jgi:hypothetical protein
MVRHQNPLIAKGDWLFASVGDPLNRDLIKTEGGGKPFHKQIMVIFTADEGIYNRIKKIAVSAGFPRTMINCFVIPSTVLYLGTGVDSDSLTIALRTASFPSKIEENKYLNNDYYATIYRVTPSSAPDHLQPFAWPDARKRDFRPEGGAFNSALQAGLERLKAAILAKTPNARLHGL